MKDNKSKHFEGAQLLRQQFGQEGSATFGQALSSRDICAVVDRQAQTTRNRLYPPLKTLSLFIGQILSGGRACQDAVVRNLSERVSTGESSSSLSTAAYCEARMRLPKAIAVELGSLLSQRLKSLSPKAWRWQGRGVNLFDGTSVSTKQNPSARPWFSYGAHWCPRRSGQRGRAGLPSDGLARQGLGRANRAARLDRQHTAW